MLWKRWDVPVLIEKINNKHASNICSNIYGTVTFAVYDCGRNKGEIRNTHLLSSLFFSFVLCGLQHFLSPEDKEVGGVSVELQCVLLVISVERKRGFVATNVSGVV